MRLSCSQDIVGLLVSAGDYQVQQYQPPLWRGHVLCVFILQICRMNPVLLMLPRKQAATSTRHSEMSMACGRTSGEMMPTASGSLRMLLHTPNSSDATLAIRTCIHPNSAFGSIMLATIREGPRARTGITRARTGRHPFAHVAEVCAQTEIGQRQCVHRDAQSRKSKSLGVRMLIPVGELPVRARVLIPFAHLEGGGLLLRDWASLCTHCILATT